MTPADELTGEQLISMVQPHQSDGDDVEFLKKSYRGVVDLCRDLDSDDWKYIKMEDMVELSRKKGKDIDILIHVDVLAPVDKILEFVTDNLKVSSLCEGYGEVDEVWKIGENSELIHHKMNYELPGGKRDFSLCQSIYKLDEGTYIIARTSVYTDRIPETSDVRGDLQSMLVIQKSTETSSIINLILKMDL